MVMVKVIDVEVLYRRLTGKREAVGTARILRLALSAYHLFVYGFKMDVLTPRLYQLALQPSYHAR